MWESMKFFIFLVKTYSNSCVTLNSEAHRKKVRNIIENTIDNNHDDKVWSADLCPVWFSKRRAYSALRKRQYRLSLPMRGLLWKVTRARAWSSLGVRHELVLRTASKHSMELKLTFSIEGAFIFQLFLRRKTFSNCLKLAFKISSIKF